MKITLPQNPFTNPAIILSLLVILNYGITLHNGFLTDDYTFLNNAQQYSFESISKFFQLTKSLHYIPLYYFINVNLFKYFFDQPFILHLFNIILFYLACLCVYQLIKTLTNNKTISILTACFFCLYPTHAYSINTISSNYLLIFIIFNCLALMCYMSHLTKSGPPGLNLLFSHIFFIISLLAFEGALLFPAYLFCILYFLRRYSWKECISATLSFLVISAVYFLMWTKVAFSKSNLIHSSQALNLTITQYFASLFELLSWYIGNLIYPQHVVHIFNVHPSSNLAGLKTFLLSLAFFLVLFLIKSWGKNIKSFSLSWFLAGLAILPAATLGHSEMGMVLEPQWFYFSCIGFFLFLAAAFIKIGQRVPPHIFKCALTIVFISLFITTQKYNIQAGSSTEYYKFWLKVAPANPVPMTFLAHRYTNDGKHQQALSLYEKILENNFDPDNTHYSTAIVYADMGQFNKAREHLKRALEWNPNFPEVYYILGKMAAMEGDGEEAEKLYNTSLKIAPYFSKSVVGLSDLYTSQGNKNEAIELLTNFLADYPTNYQRSNIKQKLKELTSQDNN